MGPHSIPLNGLFPASFRKISPNHEIVVRRRGGTRSYNRDLASPRRDEVGSRQQEHAPKHVDFLRLIIKYSKYFRKSIVGIDAVVLSSDEKTATKARRKTPSVIQNLLSSIFSAALCTINYSTQQSRVARCSCLLSPPNRP